MNKNIRSCYHDSKKEEFEMEIVGETEKCYLVRLLPEYQSKMQEKDTVTKLRKDLVGENNIYKFIDKKIVNEQLTLF